MPADNSGVGVWDRRYPLESELVRRVPVARRDKQYEGAPGGALVAPRGKRLWMFDRPVRTIAWRSLGASIGSVPSPGQKSGAPAQGHPCRAAP